jgi:hypothetical protein
LQSDVVALGNKHVAHKGLVICVVLDNLYQALSVKWRTLRDYVRRDAENHQGDEDKAGTQAQTNILQSDMPLIRSIGRSSSAQFRSSDESSPDDTIQGWSG